MGNSTIETVEVNRRFFKYENFNYFYPLSLRHQNCVVRNWVVSNERRSHWRRWRRQFARVQVQSVSKRRRRRYRRNSEKTSKTFRIFFLHELSGLLRFQRKGCLWIPLSGLSKEETTSTPSWFVSVF